MRSIDALDEALNTLKDKQDLVFILQDWDSGMQVYESCDGGWVIQQLADARGKYDDKFGFRAFNEKLDVYWNGDFGIICTDEDAGDPKQLPLVFDTKRHPGMAKFAARVNKNLQNLMIEAREVASTEGGTFLRFIKLSEVKDNDRARPWWSS